MTQSSDDLAALWRAIFGEPPPMRPEPAFACDLMVRYLPLAPPYVPGASLAAPADLDEPAEGDFDGAALRPS